MLLIERNADDKIRTYTDLCPTEISGLGKVIINADGDFVITDVAIFEQEVSGVHSTLSTTALAKFQAEMVKKGESMKDWCVWWHSHADMGVFFSGTDTGTIDESTEFPYLVSLVVNKKGQSKARVDVFKPVRMFMDLEVEVVSSQSDEITKLCKAEIAEKVKKPAPIKHVGYDYHGSGGMKHIGHAFKGAHGHKYKKGWKKGKGDIVIPFDEKGAEAIADLPFDEEESTYREHKRLLINSLRNAKIMGEAAEVYRLEGELTEWIMYGKQLGYEEWKQIG